MPSQAESPEAGARVTSQGWTAAGLTAHEFAGPSATRGLLEVGATWALLAIIIGAYLAYPRPWTFVVAFALVASRQYALLVLMHDGFHSLLHPDRRLNDVMGAWLIGAPCGSSYWGSRGAHLEHHRKLGDVTDPEFLLYSAGPPREKRSAAALARHLARLMLGEQILHTHFGPRRAGASRTRDAQLRPFVAKLLPVVVAQAVLLCAFTALDAWPTYFTLWILPLLTVVVFLNGLRVFCDHANPTDEPGDEPHRLVSYVSTPLERFFVAPFHMNYHAEHHLFTYVPHYNLPGLRRKLMATPEVTTVVQWRPTYVGFVREFLRRSRR